MVRKALRIKTEIISNVCFMRIGQARLWTNVISIMHPKMLSERRRGTPGIDYLPGFVSCYRHSAYDADFIRRFGPDDKIRYEDQTVGGILRVGNATYIVNGDVDRPVFHEDRTFRNPKEMSDYVDALLRKYARDRKADIKAWKAEREKG